MDARITNIHSAQWTEHVRKPGQQPWFELNVSGAHVGVRLEHIPPGEHSSVHHFHTLEEEHVLVLEGEGTLCWDDGEHVLKAGDHVCFPAGDTHAHHIENRSLAYCKYLVFGERCAGDVVVYPERRVMYVKALEGGKGVTYRELPPPTSA